MAADTTVHRLLEQAKARPHEPAYFVKAHGAWKATGFADYWGEVKQAAKALIALGLEAGANVCILGYNRPEWVIADLAAMAIGGAPAGIYTTCSAEEVRYIVHHCEAKVVVVENADQWKKIQQEKANLPHLRHVVTMRGAAKIDDPMVIAWDDFLAKAGGVDDARLDERMAALEPGGLATLIYTSGTTGPPKGVMLSHENLAWTAKMSLELVEGRPGDTSLSYLPLSHIAEQMFSIHGPITMAASVYFAEGLEKMPDNLKEVQPTIFFGVPRIWEKFHAGIAGKLRDAKGAKKRLVEWARSVGSRVNALENEGKQIPGLLAIQYKLADRLVFSKLKPAIGLGKARICVSGAAPIAKEVLEFMASLDITVLEVYGQSEDTGPTSFNRPGRTKLGSVGPIIPGVEVKIAEDGEILVRGPNVFLGYYKEPEATAETLVGGWLHSGDLGEIDPAGFLSITGRKKDIIITAGGKNITPKNIESAIKNHPLVSEVVVIGDRRKYLTAVVTLDPEAAAKFAKDKGFTGKPLHESVELAAEVQEAIDLANKTLARVETVKKFKILPRSFTIEDGELTPTLKVKRKAVNEHFAAEIESMYTEDRLAQA
jgi:long-chain acyl-CoA synthetase